MADMKNLDKQEREKLFNELNDALSQMQHKYYENEQKDEDMNQSVSKTGKDISSGSTVLYEGFNPKYDSSWLLVYDRKIDKLSSVGLAIKGFLFSILFQLPFNSKPHISVNDLILSKKKLKTKHFQFINYGHKKIDKAFANFMLPIMKGVQEVSSMIKSAENKDFYSFLRLVAEPYIQDTSVQHFLDQFTEDKIRREFTSKGIQEAFRYLSDKQKQVPNIFKQSLPEDLKDAFLSLELFKSFAEFVSWGSFQNLFGIKDPSQPSVKKLPGFSESMPFLVQMAYVLKQFVERAPEQRSYFLSNLEFSYKALLQNSLIKQMDIDFHNLELALKNLSYLKREDTINSLIQLILQDNDFLILGKPLYQDIFAGQFLKLTQVHIENLLYVIREEEVKSYTQHVMKEFLVSSGDLNTKLDVGIYTESNSEYLTSLKLEGFPYSIFLPLVLYYFKYIYLQTASPFLATLGFKIDYVHKGIKKGFVDMINSLSWAVTELNYFVRDNLLVRPDKTSALIKILQHPVFPQPARNAQILETQVPELNTNIKKCLQNIMKILVHLREEISVIRDDLSYSNNRSVVLTKNIPSIKGGSFSNALYKVTTEINTLLELAGFYFSVPDYKGELFTMELSKNSKSHSSS